MLTRVGLNRPSSVGSTPSLGAGVTTIPGYVANRRSHRVITLCSHNYAHGQDTELENLTSRLITNTGISNVNYMCA